MTEHTRHTVLETAVAADCYYGECEHIDENGEPDDFSACPRVPVEVCVDCMVERGLGDDPAYWEDLAPWPHTERDQPLPGGAELQGPPAILKPPPGHVRCSHSYHHDSGPHACDHCESGECPYWSWVDDHNRAVSRITAEAEKRVQSA